MNDFFLHRIKVFAYKSMLISIALLLAIHDCHASSIAKPSVTVSGMVMLQ